MTVEVASLSVGCPPRRTYILSMGTDLFGEPFVKREYGYTGGGRRVTRTTSFATLADAEAAAKRLVKSAKRRGYEE